MYYHVRITQNSNRSHDETKVDLTEEELETRVLAPYRLGDPIIINGKTIQITDVERIRINRSQHKAEALFSQLRREDDESPVTFVGGPSMEWRAADRCEDATDHLIQGAPGYARSAKTSPRSRSVASNSKVFVVHGHDQALKGDVEVFLREIHLEPIVLHRQADGGLTIIEKFEQNADVQFAVILLTPDDIAFSASERAKLETERSLEYRARQNVIFEFGYFAGRLGRSRVCCIYKEGVTLPSDISGLLYKKVSSSIGEVAYDLIRELKNAGLNPQV